MPYKNINNTCSSLNTLHDPYNLLTYKVHTKESYISLNFKNQKARVLQPPIPQSNSRVSCQTNQSVMNIHNRNHQEIEDPNA